MLYDAVCHANLQSVIRYPYPIRIRIYPYPKKITDIRKYLSAIIRGPISAHLCCTFAFGPGWDLGLTTS